MDIGLRSHPVPSVGEKPPIIFCHAENTVYLKVHTVIFQESGLGIIYIFTNMNKVRQNRQTLTYY